MLVSPTIDSILPSIACMDADLLPSPLRIGLAIFTQLDFETQTTSRFVCKRWAQWIDKVHLIKRYNHHLMNSNEIRQEATHYFCNSNSLQTEQDFLLRIVRLSIDCKNIQTAAANALMILKKTCFEFIDKDLNRIQVPGVRLPRTLLDGVNFTGANLEGADLSDCSLNGACLDKANLKEIQLGQLPALIHQEELLTMALAPDGKQVASMSTKALYLWDMETLEAQKIHREVAFTWPKKKEFLLFSADSQWLFTAHHEGKVEIWQSHPLKKVHDFTIDEVGAFTFLALTSDDKHLIGIIESELSVNLDFRTTICLWELHLSQENSPQVKLANKTFINGESQIKCNLAVQASILAVALPNLNLIQLYSLPDLQKPKEFPIEGSGRFTHLLFTPNEQFILIARQTRKEFSSDQVNVDIEIWDLAKNTRVASLSEEEEISHWQFLPQTQKLAYTTLQGTFCIRDGEKSFYHQVRERAIHFPSYQNTLFCLATDYLYQMVKNKIVISSLQKLAVRKETGMSTAIRAVSFSIDAQAFYMVNEKGKLYTYQTLTGKKTARQIARKAYPAFVLVQDEIFCFSFDTKYVLRSSSWIDANSLLLNSIPFVLFPPTSWAWSPKNYKVSQSISLFDLHNQMEIWSIEKDFLGCTFSQDGHHVVIAQPEGLEMWEISSQKKIAFASLPSAKPLPFTNPKVDLTLAPELFPKALLLTTENKSLKLWEVDWEGKKAKLVKAFPTAQAGRFINQSRLILQERNRLVVWNYPDGNEESFDFSKGKLDSFDVTQDGSLMVAVEHISTQSQSKISLWDFRQKRRMDAHVLPSLLPSCQRSIYLSPQGRYVMCWKNDSSLEKLYMWEIRENKLHLLWKMPKQLEGRNIRLNNVHHLSRKNAELLAQL